jgi:peptidoglycan/xylan/chitin deacetylase (PgdA/CDA1 family)
MSALAARHHAGARRSAGVIALVLAAVLIAACSGSSSEPAGETPAATPSAAAAGPSQVEAGAALGGSEGDAPSGEAKVIYVGPRDVPAVAVTFDTNTLADYVPRILDLLKEHGKHATFAVTGVWASINPDLLKRIVEEGHGVINHSWGHPSFTGEDTESEPLTDDQIRDELARTEAKVKEIAGVSTMPYFRPPYGDYDARVNRVVHEAGYGLNVLWLVDGMGWDGRSKGYVLSVTRQNAFNGAIFLYHTDNRAEFDALPEVIELLNERGLQMVTIAQLLGHEPAPTPGPSPSPTPTAEPARPAAAAQEPVAPVRKPNPAPAPKPTPTATPVPLVSRAVDDFETGGVAGGSGWAQPWSAQTFITLYGGHSGDRYLDMALTGTAVRWADLPAAAEARVRFWARFDSIEPEDIATLRLSFDLETWSQFPLLDEANSDGAWQLIEIALPLPVSPQRLYLSFESGMDALSDQWRLDDVEVLTRAH